MPTSSNENRDLLHVKEAAATLDVTAAHVRQKIHDGELRALRLGERGHYRIRRRDLENFLTEPQP
jgi:excisionase family DNA binding protein